MLFENRAKSGKNGRLVEYANLHTEAIYIQSNVIVKSQMIEHWMRADSLHASLLLRGSSPVGDFKIPRSR